MKQAKFLRVSKVWWQLSLFLFICSVSYIHNHIHTVHSFIHLHSPRPLSFVAIACCWERKTSLGCRAGIWIRACYTKSIQQASALPTEPRCTLLSQAAPFWAMLHSDWATLHPIEPRYTLLSHAAPYWATQHSAEPRCTLLSHAAPCCATMHPAELCCTLTDPTEPRCSLLSHAAPFWTTHPADPRCTLYFLLLWVLSVSNLSNLNPKY